MPSRFGLEVEELENFLRNLVNHITASAEQKDTMHAHLNKVFTNTPDVETSVDTSDQKTDE